MSGRTYTLYLHVLILYVLVSCCWHDVVSSLDTGGDDLSDDPGDDLSDDPGDDLSDDQIQEVVTTLNTIRSGVGASNMRKMQWSRKLETLAAKRLISCPPPSTLLTTLTPCAHVYGNSHVTDDVTVRLFDVIGRWQKQGVHYDYTDNVCSEDDKCVQYRHLVWYSADRVGCAAKWCQIPTPGGTSVTHLFLCYFSPGFPTLARPYLQGEAGSDCPPHLTTDTHGLCIGDAEIPCPPEAASFSMSHPEGTAGGVLVTSDRTNMADKSLLKVINYLATNQDTAGGGEATNATDMAPLAAPLNGGTQDLMTPSDILPEWAAWLIVMAVGSILLMILAALFIEYKKRTLLLEDTIHPSFKKPLKYQPRRHFKNHHRPRRHRRRRPKRILPRLERGPDLHLQRPARAFNNNHFRSHSRAPPTGQLPHYTGARSDLYEDILSLGNRRARGRGRRGSGSQRGLLNSPPASPELGGQRHSENRRFPSSTTNLGLWPPTGIPITSIGNNHHGNSGAQNGNYGNRQNGQNSGHHGQYENHWGEPDRYQNLGAPPPYHAQLAQQHRQGSTHTINDFLFQNLGEVLY